MAKTSEHEYFILLRVSARPAKTLAAKPGIRSRAKTSSDNQAQFKQNRRGAPEAYL
jgi:hypothetical protein